MAQVAKSIADKGAGRLKKTVGDADTYVLTHPDGTHEELTANQAWTLAGFEGTVQRGGGST